MAVVYVFTWNHSRNGDGGGWGHASLGIRGGPYISWWPDPNQERKYMVDKKQSPMLARVMQAAIGTTNVYKVQHTSMVSLQEDIVNEGRRPDEKYLIADGVLNTEKIIEWWKGYNYDMSPYGNHLT